MKDKHAICKINQKIMLFNRKKELLLVKHETGLWSLPGGRLNVDETWLEGLKREVREEISIDNFKIDKILFVDTWITKSGKYYGVCFLGKITGQQPIVPANEIVDYAWLKNKKGLDKYKFWHNSIKSMIRKYLS
jgi:8-oxo-dGTP diphosphatase